jgi:glycosyltransferase involved in cell wall biosynthesis
MKKVLFILDNLEGGGAEKVFVNIANGFVDNNIPVELLLGQKKGVNLSLLHPSITVSETGSTNFFDYCRSFIRVFKNNNYSHVFTASHYPGAAAILVKKYLGIKAKVYQTHHYAYPNKRERTHWKGDMLLKTIYYFTAPWADKIIAVSKGSLEWLRKFSHRKLPQGSYIYNPVITDNIYSLAKEKVDFPIDITGKTILLNAGRLSEQKDQVSLIKAFEIYHKKNPNAVLFILGTGPLENELKQYINVKKLQDYVFLQGFQNNPYKWMAKCDAFILSSKYEGFGNVIAEAMALGKTVVSTDCPSGPSEILEDGKLGYLCAVQDVEAMAAAIEKAISNPFDKEILAQASNKYKTNVIVQQYINTL